MYVCTLCLFFFIILLPPRSTLTVTLFPYTSLFRSLAGQHGTALGVAVARRAACGGRDRRAGLLPHLGRRRGGRHRRHRVGRAAQRPAPARHFRGAVLRCALWRAPPAETQPQHPHPPPPPTARRPPTPDGAGGG